MSPEALVFMLLSWGVVTTLVVYCYRKILQTGTTFQEDNP